MPIVQAFRLLMAVFAAVAALSVAGCSRCSASDDCGESRTVAQYLHDIDAAHAAEDRYSNDPGKYHGDPDWTNASAAIGKIQFLNDCFPKLTDGKRFTTANTDHACLDKKGYTR